MESQQLMTANELAQVLHVSAWWLYQRTRLGQEAIPHVKVGRNVRFDSQEVLDFLRKQDGTTV